MAKRKITRKRYKLPFGWKPEKRGWTHTFINEKLGKRLTIPK